VVCSAPTVAELKASLDEPPAAVLLDIRLADSSSPARNTKELLAWGTRVLIYTQGDQHEEILRALQAGASGVVHKQDPVDELVEAIHTITADELRFFEDGHGERSPGQYVSPRLAQALEILLHRSPNANLTAQELETLRLYASGMVGRDVAKAMHLSEATVKTYLRRAKDKLIQEGFEAGTKHDLRTAAIQLGILPPIV
jgi:DNA-binding NarL/FixJ family response regulator